MEPSNFLTFAEMIDILTSAEETEKLESAPDAVRKFRRDDWGPDKYIYAGRDGSLLANGQVQCACLLKRDGVFVFPWSPNHLEMFSTWYEVEQSDLQTTAESKLKDMQELAESHWPVIVEAASRLQSQSFNSMFEEDLFHLAANIGKILLEPKEPNAELAKVLEETRQGIGIVRHSSVEEMLVDLNGDDDEMEV